MDTDSEFELFNAWRALNINKTRNKNKETNQVGETKKIFAVPEKGKVLEKSMKIGLQKS